MAADNSAAFYSRVLFLLVGCHSASCAMMPCVFVLLTTACFSYLCQATIGGPVIDWLQLERAGHRQT
jgi:hypothetical protein